MNLSLSVLDYDFNFRNVIMDKNLNLLRDVVQYNDEAIFMGISIEEFENFLKNSIDINNIIEKKKCKSTLATFTKNFDNYFFNYTSSQYFKILPFQSDNIFYKLANIIINEKEDNYSHLCNIIDLIKTKLIEVDDIEKQKEKILKNILFLFYHFTNYSKKNYNEFDTTFSIIDIIIDNMN